VKVFHVETLHDRDYDEIVSLLRDGGIVAFPTDTAYGLGADPFNSAAVDRIFTVKGRAEGKPILLLVDSLAMAESVIQPDRTFYRVAEKFWPGPLTIIASAVGLLPANITAGSAICDRAYEAFRQAHYCHQRESKWHACCNHGC
jgi:tRNA threonylcarbamoyl adenosine modification protein (Sua5/YciO/YrdC/YwlC family)